MKSMHANACSHAPDFDGAPMYRLLMVTFTNTSTSCTNATLEFFSEKKKWNNFYAFEIQHILNYVYISQV